MALTNDDSIVAAGSSDGKILVGEEKAPGE